MTVLYIPEQLLQSTMEAFDVGDTEAIRQQLNDLKKDYPFDERAYYFEYTLFERIGDTANALNALWRCLDIRPQEALFLNAMAELVISDKDQRKLKSHDLWSKHDGKKTADSTANVQPDRTARYNLAAKILRQKFGSCSQLQGLDLFCRNGYGSKIINSTTGARMIGIDDSEASIQQANAEHGNHRTVFIHQPFPFVLKHHHFDFAICCESIEHVADPQALIAQIFKSTQGPVFISVPAEETLPLKVNKKLFQSHHRHFKIGEILEICNGLGTHQLQRLYGQETCVLDNMKVSAAMASEKMYIKPHTPQSQFHLLHFDAVIAH